jgi:hypothetical protein
LTRAASDRASICFCTLAIHGPYRERARHLCADLTSLPFVVLTDEPADFADLPVRAIRHTPTGPMAIDYVQRIGPTGNNNGAAAYHDKRFAVAAALRDFDTAIFLDADSRIPSLPAVHGLAPGLTVVPVVRRSIASHLETCGSWRRPAFDVLALELFGDLDVLDRAAWCHETCFAVTKDGNEPRFFAAWDRAADLMHRQRMYSGEGGVMGLAAAFAGWTPDYDALLPLMAAIQHEGGGPKA